QQSIVWAQRADELCCVRHCYEAVHFAQTPSLAPRGRPRLADGSSHISVCWAQLSDSGGRISTPFRGLRYPAAYRDLVAAILAIVAISGLVVRTSWAILAICVFNVWGALDLLHAFYQGQFARIGPGSLGAAFFIPTVVVPP